MATKTHKTIEFNGAIWDFTKQGETLFVTKTTDTNTVKADYDLAKRKLPVTVYTAFSEAFPRLSKNIAPVSPKSNTQKEVVTTMNAEIVKLVDGTEVHEPLSLLPRETTQNFYLRPQEGVENTVADPTAVAVIVNDVRYPLSKARIKEACRVHFGTAPVVTPGGKFEAHAIGVSKKNVKGEITSFEFRVRETGISSWRTVWANDKECLNALKDYLVPGMRFNLHSLGSLIKGGKVNTHIEKIGNLVDNPVFAWRINRAIELDCQGESEQAQGQLEQARYDLIPEFSKEIEENVIGGRGNLRITNVVLDTDRIGRNILGLGLKFAHKVLREVNRIRIQSGLEIRPVSLEDLHDLEFEVAVRYPVDSPTNVIVGKIILVEENVNAVFANAEDLLDANGDADGDTLAIELAHKVLKSLVGHKRIGEDDRESHRTKEVEYLRCIPRITEFKTPVDKEGNQYTVGDFEPVGSRNPIDIMVGQMAKTAFTGAVTNGMNALAVLARCLGNDPISRLNLINSLGLDRKNHLHQGNPLTSAQAYKSLVTINIKRNLIILDEAIMDVWKGQVGTPEGDEAAHLPHLNEVMQFLTEDDYYLSEQHMKELSEDFDARLLNQIKTLGGGFAPQVAIQQWPIAASIIGSEISTDAILNSIKVHGSEKTLAFLDGSEIEPRIQIGKEDRTPRAKVQKPWIREATGFTYESFENPWTAIQQYVNRISEGGFQATIENHTLVLKFVGKTVRLTPYVFTVDESRTCVYVKRGSSSRVARLIATQDVRNAGRLIRAGMPIKQALGTCRYETILDKFAYKCVELLKTAREEEISSVVFEDIAVKGLTKVFEDYTEVINTPEFEVFLHDQRVNIELPEIGGVHLIPVARELVPHMEIMINPLDGEEIQMHPGLTSKNKPGGNAGIFYSALDRKTPKGDVRACKADSCPIDLVAHILGGMPGVNQARLWKEGWTTRFAQRFVTPGSHRMTNGWEVNLPELHERSKDVLVLIADMDSWLSYEIKGRRITSDKGLLTPYGAQILETIPHVKKDTGLPKHALIRVCESITGTEGESAIQHAEQLGYVIVESYRPLDRDLATGEPIDELIYTLVHPKSTETASWMKLYFEGYKGIFLKIDQDFEVEVGSGRREKVAAIMDSRTFASKKMQAAYIAGALALYRESMQFGSRKPIYGAESLHEDLQFALLDENNESGYRKVFDMEGNELGHGLTALFRTFVLKADPDYMSIEDKGFKATPDIMGLTGRKYHVAKSLIKRLEAQAKAVLQ